MVAAADPHRSAPARPSLSSTAPTAQSPRTPHDPAQRTSAANSPSTRADRLRPSAADAVVTALRKHTQIAGTLSGGIWTIQRRNVTYTVTHVRRARSTTRRTASRRPAPPNACPAAAADRGRPDADVNPRRLPPRHSSRSPGTRAAARARSRSRRADRQPGRRPRPAHPRLRRSRRRSSALPRSPRSTGAPRTTLKLTSTRRGVRPLDGRRRREPAATRPARRDRVGLHLELRHRVRHGQPVGARRHVHGPGAGVRLPRRPGRGARSSPSHVNRHAPATADQLRRRLQRSRNVGDLRWDRYDERDLQGYRVVRAQRQPDRLRAAAGA